MLTSRRPPSSAGLTADGTPKIGQFECGFSPDCDRVCNFVTACLSLA